MMRIAVKIAYIGDNFSGSQIQPGFKTVEGEILIDLEKICHQPPEEYGLRLASRTDKGVNATGNVAVFYTDFKDAPTLLRALNAVSKNIFYRSFAIVDDSFIPRFANARTYRYIFPKKKMDVTRAKDCAALFVGEHDFVKFCRYDGKSTVVAIDSISVTEDEGIVILDFRAKYYLWNMIRRISAAIYAVSTGRSALSDIQTALEGQDMTFGLARADALTLVDVIYDELTFETPIDVLSQRADDELFSIELIRAFFSSLK